MVAVVVAMGGTKHSPADKLLQFATVGCGTGGSPQGQVGNVNKLATFVGNVETQNTLLSS